MSSSTRLYERLDQIPNDPENPESLEDVVVCAFGAFERYYVCWKTREGEYRQDGHDLPQELREFLYEQERDFASLQVVFGRGNEFFASDKYGKLEYKEPEPEKKEPSPEELEEKRALRRSRTISFMRPRSGESQKPTVFDMDSPSSSNRSSFINGRPPSMSLSYRSNSDASLHSLHSQPDPRPPSTSHARLDSDSSLNSSRPSSNQTSISSRPSSYSDTRTDDSTTDPAEEEKSTPPPPISQSTRRLRPLSLAFKSGLIRRIPEGKQVPSPESQFPLPPVPSIPPTFTLPMATSAKSWTPAGSSPSPPDVQLVQEEQKVEETPKTEDDARGEAEAQTGAESKSEDELEVPVEISEQNEARVAALKTAQSAAPTSESGAEAPPPAPLSLQISTTTVQTTPFSPTEPSPHGNSFSPARLRIYISDTLIETAPISPVAAPAPEMEAPIPPPRLSIQISSTIVETAPLSPIPTSAGELTATHPPPTLSTTFSQSTPPTDPSPSTSPPPSLTSTSTQTTPPPSPLRTPLRIDTSTAVTAFPAHTYSISTTSSALDVETPQDYYYEPPPVFMGRMLDYYSKPGYQLGDSLFGGYGVGVGVGEEGEMDEWERANGRGY